MYQDPSVGNADRVGLQRDFRRFRDSFASPDIEFAAMQGAMHPIAMQAAEVKGGVFVRTHVIHSIETVIQVADEDAFAVADVDTFHFAGFDFVYTACIESGVIHEHV